MSWTEHRTSQYIADELGVTSGTLINFIKKQKLKLFRTYKKIPNTGEINTRRKSERPKKQRRAKEILGEGCGGLDGAGVWRVGRTAEDQLMYRRLSWQKRPETGKQNIEKHIGSQLVCQL